MKKLAPLGLAVVMLLAGLAVSSPRDAKAQGTAGLVSSILNNMERNHRSLKSLRARISMVKYNSQLRDEDKYNGVVAYQPAAGRNANIRVEWQSPKHEILAVSNGEYTLYNPRLNMAYVGDSRSKRASGGLFDMLSLSGQQLRARFEPVQELREETLWGGVHTYHLKLVPKGGASYKYAEIWVDDGGMPVQAKVVEKNDDATTVRLMNLEKNAPISSNEFRLQLGNDVKRVRG
jgi:outer membrane lipoprotein-sorting protein